MFTRSWWWRARSIFTVACAGFIGTVAMVGAAACSSFSNGCEQFRNCPLSSPDSGAALDASFASGRGGAGGGSASSGRSPGVAGTAGAAAAATTRSVAGTRPSSDLDASDAEPSVRDSSVDTTGDAQSGEGDSGTAADGALLCRSGFADCDHDASNGCETALADDPEHCGTCDVVCGTTGVAARSCAQGTCKPTCDPKHRDCDGNPINGCEVDVTTNPDNCGACKRACSSAKVTTRACVASVCTPAQCAVNYASCVAPSAPAADDGCETDLTTSKNCGGCGHDCELGTCGLISSNDCGPYDLLTNTNAPDQLVADASYVHFTQAGSTSDKQLERITIRGTITPATVIDNVPIDNLTTDGTFVYWSYMADPTGGIDRIQSGTSTEQIVRTGISNPGKVAADPANVYWLDYSNDTVYKSAPATGAPAAIWIDFANSVGDMESDGTTLFVSSWAALLASNVTTKVLTSQTSLPGLGLAPIGAALAFDATHVYAWFQESTTSSDFPYRLVRLDKPTLTNPVTLAAAPDAPSVMFVVANHVYFQSAAAIERVATDGSGQDFVAGDPLEPPGSSSAVIALAATSTALYWIQPTLLGDTIRKMLVY